jgi:hypothetical protein
MSIDEILHAHGYHSGTEEERLLLVFKDLAHDRAVLAVYKLAKLPPHIEMMIQFGIKNLVDS